MTDISKMTDEEKKLLVGITPYETLFVGIQANEQTGDETTTPLGFVVPDGETPAAKKLQSTVERWCAGYHYGHAPAKPFTPTRYQNSATMGFTLDRVVSRWRTQNKLFRVNDPRGWQIEISTENLMYIMLNSEISNGVVQTPLVYARKGGTNWLVSPKHIEARNELDKTGIKVRALKVGQIVHTKRSVDDHLVFCGNHRITVLSDAYTRDDHGGYKHTISMTTLAKEIPLFVDKQKKLSTMSPDTVVYPVTCETEMSAVSPDVVKHRYEMPSYGGGPKISNAIAYSFLLDRKDPKIAEAQKLAEAANAAGAELASAYNEQRSTWGVWSSSSRTSTEKKIKDLSEKYNDARKAASDFVNGM